MPSKSVRSADADEGVQKSYRTILEQEIIAGLHELRRPTSGLFLSSLSAGLDIGFSVLLAGIALTLLGTEHGTLRSEAVLANLYSVGFVLVLLGRSELFTEHTALAVLPVLRGRSRLPEVGRVWAVVFGGNVLGSLLFAPLMVWIAPALGIVEPEAFGRMARQLVDHPRWVMLGSGVLAGWLMGELGWIIAAARDTISQVVFVWLVTAVIGFAHLHHVIVGTVEIAAGCLVGAVTWPELLDFLWVVTLGNAVGGVVFVGFIKYGHASRSAEGDEPEQRAEPELPEETGEPGP